MKYSLILIAALLSADTIKIDTDKFEKELTIYNNGYGLIKETGTINIDSNGKHKIIVGDIPSGIVKDSFKLNSSINVLSQSYNFNILSLDTLLERNIGKKIDYIDEANWEVGTLLSINPLLIKTISNQVITLDNHTQLRFKSIPDDLLLTPNISLNIETNKGVKPIENFYLTEGLNWKSNYIINLKDNKLDIDGWLTVINNSGKNFKNAKIKCIAGDVNKINKKEKITLARMSIADSNIINEIEPKEIFGNYIYEIKEKESLNNKEEKQMSFLSRKNIDFKTYIEEESAIQFYSKDKKDMNLVNVIEFESKEQMPMGTVRVFVDDKFLGENQIDSKSKAEIIKIGLGRSYDVRGTETIVEAYSKKEESYMKSKIELSNYSNKEIEIKISKVFFNEELRDNCVDYCSRKIEDGKVIYKIMIPAKEKYSFEYSVRKK